MKFPWHRRAERATRQREDSERRLAAVESDWEAINLAVGVADYEYRLNGFTSHIQTIFRGSESRGPNHA